jgi:hypothetical protein
MELPSMLASAETKQLVENRSGRWGGHGTRRTSHWSVLPLRHCRAAVFRTRSAQSAFNDSSVFLAEVKRLVGRDWWADSLDQLPGEDPPARRRPVYPLRDLQQQHWKLVCAGLCTCCSSSDASAFDRQGRRRRRHIFGHSPVTCLEADPSHVLQRLRSKLRFS